MRKQRSDKKVPFFAQFKVGEKIEKKLKWGDVVEIGTVIDVCKSYLTVKFPSDWKKELPRTKNGQIDQRFDQKYNYIWSSDGD